MNKDKTGSRLQRGLSAQAGFTLVEIGVVVALFALILGVVLASVSSSRKKAVDAETKKTLSEMALQMEAKEIAPGVIDYAAAFEAINGSSVLAELAAKYNIGSGEYEYQVLAKSYAIVFPLKQGGYYCIDSAGRATGREVIGLFYIDPNGLDYVKDCNAATRTAASGDIPTITIFGENPADYIIEDDCKGNTNVIYNEPGFEATDTEDGDITSSVVSTPSIYSDPKSGIEQGEMFYDVSDSDNNQALTVGRSLNVIRNQCPGGGDGGIDDGGGPIFIPVEPEGQL